MSETKKKSIVKRATERVKKDNENGARQAVIEDLFFDFNRSRTQIYWINFIRGIFFGIGSVIGITLFIVISVWLLSKTADVFPALADFINQLIDTMQRRR